MDAEIKKRWVNALRSGKYKHGRGRLCTQFGHCAFGVLAEELGSEVSGYSFIGLDYSYGATKALFDTTNKIWYPSSLPTTYLEQIGLSRMQALKIIAKNDIELQNFNEIADYIKGVF